MKLWIDIETRGTADLRKTGQYAYAEHPATEIIMLAYSLDGETVRVWLPPRSTCRDTGVSRHVQTVSGKTAEVFGGEIPDDLYLALLDETVQIVAHNASFERVLLTHDPGKRIGVPVAALADLGRWDCTAARAASVGLPRTLEGACAALNLPVQKDKSGYSLMLRMCKPRAKTGFNGVPAAWVEDEESILREAAYCADDVFAEILIDRDIPALIPVERQVWETTELMNDSGVLVDTELLLQISLLIEDAERDVNGRISDATGGAVPRVSDHGALTRWLTARGINDAAETGVGKAAVSAMLENTDLDPLIRSVLLMRRDGGGSSAKKYKAILTRLSNDGRLRGALVYSGAAATGRWSSRGAQLQNLPRGGSVKNTDGAIRDLLDGARLGEIEEIHGPPLVVASELLRPVFISRPGYWLARGDYSQIEARVIAWLAGEKHVLDAFRAYDDGTGPDLYKVTAAGIFGVPAAEVDKSQRQIGKVAALALGFQGGKGAFQAMARAYGVRVTEAQAEAIKIAWRAANPRIASTGHLHPPGLWKQLERAAVHCLETTPGAQINVGNHGVFFKRNRKALALALPSGRRLIYWSPRLQMQYTPWGEKLVVVYRSEDSQTKRWTEFAAYGGLWTENLVQATARELMADSLVRLARCGLRPVLTVHDEGIVEAPRARFERAADAAAAVEQVMRQTPAWAAGLPVAADASAALRYVKG